MIFPRMTSFIENSRWRPDLLKACIPGAIIEKTQIRTSIVYKILRTNTEQIPTLVVVFGILTDDVLVMLPWAVEHKDLVGEGQKVEGSV